MGWADVGEGWGGVEEGWADVGNTVGEGSSCIQRVSSLLKLSVERYAWMVASMNVTVTLFMWIWLLLTHLYFLFMSAMMSVMDSAVWDPWVLALGKICVSDKL